MAKTNFLTAKEATRQLGVTPDTLYAYVSRGLIRSETLDARKRTRRYSADDVQKLKERKELRKNPAKIVQNALHWGTPIMESALTLITEDSLYYRGYDVCWLAVNRSVEEIAALLWTGSFNSAGELFANPNIDNLFKTDLARTATSLPLIKRLSLSLTLASVNDLAAYDLRPARVAQTGARILQRMILSATDEPKPKTNLAQMLSATFCPKDSNAQALLNAALILCADHELNVSALTARVVASAEANPYEVVLASLGAMQGFKHGGGTARVEALFDSIRTTKQIDQVLSDRLRRGESIPGFGHPLYPKGDPRGRLLFQLINQNYPKSSGFNLIQTVAERASKILNTAPTIDFALVALTRVLNLPDGTALAIFAMGRTIGWIGHAIEQYQLGSLIRPRAQYIGVPPQPIPNEN